MELDQIKEVEISIVEKKHRSTIGAPSSPSIFEVPECIRKTKEECYTPSVVSIGPLHNKHPRLASMQDMKLRHLDRILQVRSDTTLQDYIEMVGDMEDEIRGSYAEKISLSSNELIELVLLDASFIIYFIIGMSSPLDLLPVEDKLRLLTCVTQDLLLLENQIPFFVLERLYEKTFHDRLPQTSFIDPTCTFLASSYVPGAKSAKVPATSDRLKASKIKHLLDLLWLCCLPTVLREQQPPVIGNTEYPMSASNLKAAGVKFLPSKSISLLDISFKEGVLEIPTFARLERTEFVFRNLLAYEQCLHIGDSYFMDYLTFLDNLVDTSEDVEILMKSGILRNWIGDNDRALTLFNGMTINSVFLVNNFYYSRVCRDLNDFAKIPCNSWMAVLRRNYFSHPWAIISVIYAIILLSLTILQVIAGFK